MKSIILIFLGSLMLSLSASAQVATPIDPGCGYNLSTIICKYDDNGNRIFRGFDIECPPSGRAADGSGTPATKTAKTDNSSTSPAALAGRTYPNPTAADFTISLAAAAPAGAVVYIYDTQGRLLVEQYVESTELHLSLAPYAAGLYMVAIVHKGQVYYTAKVTKTE
jgi:Secretion system C-terminal sorting domain